VNIDHFSYLIDREHRFLLIGIIVLVMSVIFTLSGTTLERYGRIVNRAEEPKRFWWNVAGWVCFGLFFTSLYWYQNSN
jgi:hypothetical protein